MIKIKRILVPTDFSESARSVYQQVCDTAENYQAKVDMIHIVPLIPYFGIISPDAMDNPFTDEVKSKQVHAILQAKLEEELETYFPESVRGKVFVKDAQRPSAGIVAHAKAEGYDLITIASRGRGNSVFSRGTVTEKLIRLARTPVLSANNDFDNTINTIVMPTDASRVSLEALPWAMLVAERNKAKIELLGVSVFDSGIIKLAGASSYRYKDFEIKEFIFEALKKYVESNTEGISFVGEPSVDKDSFKLQMATHEPVDLSIVVERGTSAHSVIVSYAREQADVVVMATHGRHAVANLFLGSTTEKVLKQLRKPVLTTKPLNLQS